MKLQNNNKGFTLIELLVVITIIGILATGATATYTSQIQKARDTTRINDIKALQGAIEQVYQDRAEYPPSSQNFLSDSNGVAVGTYLQKLPRDPKNGQTCNKGEVAGANIPSCLYKYKVTPDQNGVQKGAFLLLTAFESSGKVTTDAKNDGGKVTVRWEVGNGVSMSGFTFTDAAYSSGLLDTFKSASGILKEDSSTASTGWDVEDSIITINGVKN